MRLATGSSERKVEVGAAIVYVGSMVVRIVVELEDMLSRQCSMFDQLYPMTRNYFVGHENSQGYWVHTDAILPVYVL